MKKILTIVLLFISTFTYTQDEYGFDPFWYEFEQHFGNEIHVEIVQWADSACQTLGLERNFEFLNCPGLNNALAVILPSRTNPYDKVRYIAYDWNYLQKLEKKSGSQYAALGVEIHEVGHHLNGDPLTASGSTPKIELDADSFVGSTIAMLGGSLYDALSGFLFMPDPLSNRTHPPRWRRLIAIEQGWKNQARRYPKAQRGDTQKAKAAYARGMKATSTEDKTECFTVAISHNLGFTEAYYERGQALLEMEQYELAELDFSEVLKAQSGNTNALSGLALARFKQGHQEAALSLLDTASANTEMASTSFFIRAMVYNGNGATASAERCFTKAIALNPDCAADIYYQRALVRQQLNQHASAIDDLNRVILQQPAFTEAYKAKGRSLLNLKNPKSAFENLKVAYQFDSQDGFYSSDADLLFLMAKASFDLGQHQDALYYLTRIYERTVECYLLLARIHLAEDDFVSALDACRRAFKMEPENKDALDLLNVVVDKMNQKF